MSRRGKKRVDYSHFGVLDEDDDDFAEFTPPASKKIKTCSSKSEGKSKDKSSSKTEKKNKNGRTERKSLNRPQPADEIFENELQMALEMSISESQEVKGESPLVDSNKENKSQEEMESLQHGKEGGDSSNIVSVGADVKEDIKPCKPVVVANRSDDEIEVIATDITENVKPRRTPAPKKSKKQEESDFEDDMDDISSEDDDDDDDYSGEDSDFDDGKKKSKSKVKVKQPKKSAAASKVKAAPVSKVKEASGRATKPSAAKSTVKTPTLKTSSAARPSVARPSPVNRPPLTSPSPRWNPPGPAGNKKGDTSSLCSPTSGLRLGLSRNMKLKPLHPNLQVQH